MNTKSLKAKIYWHESRKESQMVLWTRGMERKKIMPDKWEFTYGVSKRRAGNAPKGSGVPVGTEYHWYILADQNVKKLDANNYTTSMIGLKYKLAPKWSTNDKWSRTNNAQKME